jgi:hypothetical protein
LEKHRHSPEKRAGWRPALFTGASGALRSASGSRRNLRWACRSVPGLPQRSTWHLVVVGQERSSAKTPSASVSSSNGNVHTLP